MVKPTPDPPFCNLSQDHPLLRAPSPYLESDNLPELVSGQRALNEAAGRNAHTSPTAPPTGWKFWQRRAGT
jgi:hypothetical protein